MKGVVEQFEALFERQGHSIRLYDSSTVVEENHAFVLMREGQERGLVIIHPDSERCSFHHDFISTESGTFRAVETDFEYHICPCNHANALSLRRRFPFTVPRAIGLSAALGAGDRVGLATPGHIRALRKFRISPVLAQQSVREMARTARSPEEVLDDVSWAVFQEGYRDGFAADADHLKSEKDIEDTFNAGFTMYTIDPSDLVSDEVDVCDSATLEERFEKLPWDQLNGAGEELLERYLRREFNIDAEGGALQFDFSRKELLRAAVKYLPAIARVIKLKAHLDGLFDGKPFDLEVSLDETRAPTSLLEHFFMASELNRLGLHVSGLAVHFTGRFEKGIDYMGDLGEFERTFREHVIVSGSCDPYKVSIHSGSDKFSIYPIIGKLAGGSFHLKTAGTSYLETLRIVARHDPPLFRRIIKYSMAYFDADRKTYAISTKLSMIPDEGKVKDEDLEETFLNGNSGRQLLHVTFGSILTARAENGGWLFRDRMRMILFDHEEEYYGTIQTYFERLLTSLGVERRVS